MLFIHEKICYFNILYALYDIFKNARKIFSEAETFFFFFFFQIVQNFTLWTQTKMRGLDERLYQKKMKVWRGVTFDFSLLLISILKVPLEGSSWNAVKQRHWGKYKVSKNGTYLKFKIWFSFQPSVMVNEFKSGTLFNKILLKWSPKNKIHFGNFFYPPPLPKRKKHQKKGIFFSQRIYCWFLPELFFFMNL